MSRLPLPPLLCLLLAGAATTLGGCSEPAPLVERSGRLSVGTVQALLRRLEGTSLWEESAAYMATRHGGGSRGFVYTAETEASEQITLEVDVRSGEFWLTAWLGTRDGRAERAESSVAELASAYGTLADVALLVPAFDSLAEERINAGAGGGPEDMWMLGVVVAGFVLIPLALVIGLVVLFAAGVRGPDTRREPRLPPIGGRPR